MTRAPIAQGETLPAELLTPLRDSRDVFAEKSDDSGDGASDILLRQRLNDDGYLYLPGFFSRDDITAARRAVLERLAEVGEIGQPAVEGIYTGASQRRERIEDLGKFWRSVSETWALRRLSHGMALHRLMGRLLGGPSVAQDYLFLRPATPGKFTHIHCDYPFFTRATDNVATVWVALGDVPIELGPLFLVENSHRFDDIIAQQRGFDVARDRDRQAAFPHTPLAFARERQTRLIAGGVSAGDIIIFQMFMLHGALDNTARNNRVRLSCDVRYQLASDARDPRYFGPDPAGTTGAGYGELIGAKPLTDAWHVR